MSDKTKVISDCLTSIDAKIAEQLAKWDGYHLSLDGLVSLDAATTAEQLAKWEGSYLHLNGLTSIDAATAEQLSKWNGVNLHLSGLSSIDGETAAHLAKWKGNGLWLNGLKEINPLVAKPFSHWEGSYLYLNGLTELDGLSATFLAGGSVDLFDPELNDFRPVEMPKTVSYSLCLNGLKTLDKETARSLHAGICPNIMLTGLSKAKLDPAVQTLLMQPKITGRLVYVEDL